MAEKWEDPNWDWFRINSEMEKLKNSQKSSQSLRVSECGGYKSNLEGRNCKVEVEK